MGVPGETIDALRHWTYSGIGHHCTDTEWSKGGRRGGGFGKEGGREKILDGPAQTQGGMSV